MSNSSVSVSVSSGEVGTGNGAVEVSAGSGTVEVDAGSGTNSKKCVIFDWDDTLLCSSWLDSMGFNLNTPDCEIQSIRPHLDKLEEAAANLLRRALVNEPSGVMIITNAQTDWVELSCKKFIPKVLGILSKITVVSARSTFEHQFPNSPEIWKAEAFRIKIREYYGDKPIDLRKDVLSFGDSIHERKAVHKATSTMGSSTLTKSIKFVERPTIEQLVRPQNLGASCLFEICKKDESLDLMLTIQLIYSSP
jgi:hypothetical protein